MSRRRQSLIAEFLADHRAMFQRVARRWYRPHLASTFDDYHQAMTVAITEHWHELPADPEERTAWIWRILGNAAQSLHLSDQRAIRRRHTIPDEMPLDDLAVDRETGAEELAHSSELLEHLRSALGRLPHNCRRVVSRYYGLDGEAGANTAALTSLQLGISTAEVRKHLTAAMEQLEEEFDAYAI